MEYLKERIELLKNIEKLLKEKGNIDNPMDVWISMGLFNPYYVINEKNNIIKFSWSEAFLSKSVCIVVTWDNKYNNCKLLYCDKRFYNHVYKTLKLTRNNVKELENYLYENNFFNYLKIEDCMQLDGSQSELEVKMHNKYKLEDDNGCSNNKIIYGFATLLFELAKEDPRETLCYKEKDIQPPNCEL